MIANQTYPVQSEYYICRWPMPTEITNRLDILFNHLTVLVHQTYTVKPEYYICRWPISTETIKRLDILLSYLTMSVHQTYPVLPEYYICGRPMSIETIKRLDILFNHLTVLVHQAYSAAIPEYNIIILTIWKVINIGLALLYNSNGLQDIPFHVSVIHSQMTSVK